MKQFLKSLLRQSAPSLFARVKASRARANSQQLEKEWGCAALTHKLVHNRGPTVSGGPCQGLTFIPRTFERHLAPKLLGTYEQELHPVWDRILQQPYEQIMDVGCAEGYYAVGLARHFYNTPVHAFDTDWWARRTTRRMAEANDVDNVHVHGACSMAWFAEYLHPHAFILSDCEGFEDELFNPVGAVAPRMATCDILIELHEGPAPGVTERLVNRFTDTHKHTLIPRHDRHLMDLPEMPFLTREEKQLALREHRRDDHKWLLLEARRS